MNREKIIDKVYDDINWLYKNYNPKQEDITIIMSRDYIYRSGDVQVIITNEDNLKQPQKRFLGYKLEEARGYTGIAEAVIRRNHEKEKG